MFAPADSKVNSASFCAKAGDVIPRTIRMSRRKRSCNFSGRMPSYSPALWHSRPCLSFQFSYGSFCAIFCQRRLYLTTKVDMMRTHLRCQSSRGGADLSNAATAANLPQKLTELWLLDFTLSLHSHYVVVMPSLVPNNDIKRKPFSCRIQPSSDMGTTDVSLRRYSPLKMTVFVLFVKIFASYLSSKK